MASRLRVGHPRRTAKMPGSTEGRAVRGLGYAHRYKPPVYRTHNYYKFDLLAVSM